MNHHPLTDLWTIYAHDKKDTDFTNHSYKKCYTFATLEEFWTFFNNINDFTRHQFYIMRSKIPPKYECDENKDGGSCSYLIHRTFEVKPTIIQLLIRIICGQLLPCRDYEEITGLYINPKIEGANVKIWFKNYNWLKNNWKLILTNDIKNLRSQRISKHNK